MPDLDSCDFEALFWGNVKGLTLLYESESDAIILVPYDWEGEDIPEASFALPAEIATELASGIQELVKGGIKLRRLIRKASEKGVSEDCVVSKFSAPYWSDVADEIVKRAARGQTV